MNWTRRYAMLDGRRGQRRHFQRSWNASEPYVRLKGKRDDAWRAYDEATRDIDRQKDAVLDETSTRLEQRIEETPLFTLRWQVS